jgi:hypothetical protein
MSQPWRWFLGWVVVLIGGGVMGFGDDDGCAGLLCAAVGEAEY